MFSFDAVMNPFFHVAFALLDLFSCLLCCLAFIAIIFLFPA